MSDLPASLRRAHRAAVSAVQTGPANAVRATTPVSPYRRDRLEAPSNRAPPRERTLRGDARSALRTAAAPETFAAFRERPDVPRIAQELTGLPMLARGVGGLTAMAQLGMRGELGSEHIAPGAMAVGETALGLLPLAFVPRGAPRGALRAPRSGAPAQPGATGPASQWRIPHDLQEVEAGATQRALRLPRVNETNGGQIVWEPEGNAWRVRESYLDPSLRGKGNGVALYEALIDRARRSGASEVVSDVQVSPAAQHIYGALERRGYPVERTDNQTFRIPLGDAQRIRPPAREIGPNGMPIAQAQPTRNSFRGGSSDLREAAGMGAAPPVGRISGMPAPEGRRIVYQGGPRPLQGDTLDDAALGTGQGAATFGRGHYVAENPIVGESYARQLGDDGRGFTHELDIPEGPYIDLFKPFSQQDPRAQEAIRRLAPQFNWDAVTSEMSDALTILGRNEQRVAERLSGEGVRGFRYLDQRSRPGSGLSHLADPTSNYVVFRGADAQRRFPDFGARTPPPTTPTGTAPFGDPRAYPQSAWEEFGSLQGGAPEARLRAQEQGYTGPWYRGLSQPYDDAQANPAFFVNDPRYASDFATGQDGANVVPVMLRTRGARQVPYADIEGQYDGMWNGSVGDGVVVSQEPSSSGRMLAVARPGGDIRSIFAAFDPAKRDSSDLLASPLRGRTTLGDDVQRLSAQVNEANVDPRLARDYDQALARGINSSVRDEILSLPTAATRETATYADRSRMMEPVNGDQFSVRVGPVPYGLQDGSVYAHHNHPMAGVPSDIVAPLSLEDLDFLRANRDVRGTFAHESGGGGSYAERGGRLGHRNARTALHRGVNAAGARMGDARGVESGEALLATGRAARRVGMLRRYGYRPSNADQAEALEAAAPNMSAAEWDALRAMHGPIYGLPYPLTWGRIGLATAGGTAAAGALSQQQTNTGRSNRRPGLFGAR